MARNSQNNVSESDTTATVKSQYEGINNFAYVGPSIPSGRLKSNTVLSGTYAEITEYYEDIITSYPKVAKLIIPLSRLAEAREKTQVSGNVMYNYYSEIEAAINGNIPEAKGDEQ